MFYVIHINKKNIKAGWRQIICLQEKICILDLINRENILTYCVDEGGRFEWFVAIVNKYGIVPSIEMPETINSKDSTILRMLFTEKVKKDAIKLIEMKQKNISIDNIRKEKKKDASRKLLYSM